MKRKMDKHQEAVNREIRSVDRSYKVMGLKPTCVKNFTAAAQLGLGTSTEILIRSLTSGTGRELPFGGNRLGRSTLLHI